MSGLFCNEPKFSYQSNNDDFMIEIFDNGRYQLLNFINNTTTVFDYGFMVRDLSEMLNRVCSDQDMRDHQK